MRYYLVEIRGDLLIGDDELDEITETPEQAAAELLEREVSGFKVREAEVLEDEEQ